MNTKHLFSRFFTKYHSNYNPFQRRILMLIVMLKNRLVQNFSTQNHANSLLKGTYTDMHPAFIPHTSQRHCSLFLLLLYYKIAFLDHFIHFQPIICALASGTKTHKSPFIFIFLHPYFTQCHPKNLQKASHLSTPHWLKTTLWVCYLLQNALLTRAKCTANSC